MTLKSLLVLFTLQSSLSCVYTLLLLQNTSILYYDTGSTLNVNKTFRVSQHGPLLHFSQVCSALFKAVLREHCDLNTEA